MLECGNKSGNLRHNIDAGGEYPLGWRRRPSTGAASSPTHKSTEREGLGRWAEPDEQVLLINMEYKQHMPKMGTPALMKTYTRLDGKGFIPPPQMILNIINLYTYP